MRRSNTIQLVLGAQEEELMHRAKVSVALHNTINYRRRQSYLNGKVDYSTTDEYNDFKTVLGSATTQQIIRKCDEEWRSYWALLKLWKAGGLEDKPGIPGYWDKKNPTILMRNDSYRFEGNILKLPKKLEVKWKGNKVWTGKQGRMEIFYKTDSKKWYAFIPMEVEAPETTGDKTAYIDLGIKNIFTFWIEGAPNAEIFSGRPLLADWRYLTDKLSKLQSELGKRSSKRLRRLYTKRQRRFRHAINTIVARFTRKCVSAGVSKVVIGDVKGIRNSGSKGRTTNSLVHNFWSFGYVYDRLQTTLKNNGIELLRVDEAYTSKTCCLCGVIHKNGRKHRGLYVCPDHGVSMNADVNGVANIKQNNNCEPPGSSNWAMASPVRVLS